ncbi:hypothetical protein R1sor_016722 [Riccia sorocarpa]|uniref:Endonuclease/exonuclease/phosphatase domain-containing protein n=1 Tax=Riccia sorocarpa TaxID=122646 RepID=A0ABD3HGA2_9MARC
MRAETFISTWNLNGLGDENKLVAVRRWLQNAGHVTHILALQELKAHERRLDFNVKRLIQNATCITDYSQSERGDAALLIHPSAKVEQSGIRGDGSVAWAKLQIGDTKLSVASIYSPHDSTGKSRLYQWLQEPEVTEDWIMLGDWNMVLNPEDYAGKTALLKGRALEVWRVLNQSWGFQDAYDATTNKSGPHYTRQVIRGNRLDQARLDRIYLNRQGEWIHGVTQIQHDSKESVSDHIPVTMTCLLSQLGRSTRKKRSGYLKMDPDSLKIPERKARVKQAWEEGWSLSPDPVIAWELAWDRARQVSKDFRKEDRAKLSKLAEKQLELEDMRCRLAEGINAPDWEDYTNLEKEVHDLELPEANEQGVLINNEEEILKKVHQFYNGLYDQPAITEGERQERRRVLSLVDRHVDAEENRKLITTPERKEVESIVRSLPRDKAPGEDGVTAEILQQSWEWVGTPCISFLTAVWIGENLGQTNRTAIVKLIPKNADKLQLKNWRPISLLSLTYKLIAEILANRLKELIRKLVDEDQTGVVHQLAGGGTLSDLPV